LNYYNITSLHVINLLERMPWSDPVLWAKQIQVKGQVVVAGSGVAEVDGGKFILVNQNEGAQENSNCKNFPRHFKLIPLVARRIEFQKVMLNLSG
jgi:hypothetical protein